MKTKELTSIYKGGRTAEFVRAEIKDRFGEKAAKEYDPTSNCFTFNGWKQRGYVVKKGEKAIKSITFIEDEETKKKYPRTICLFAKPQVEIIKEKGEE